MIKVTYYLFNKAWWLSISSTNSSSLKVWMHFEKSIVNFLQNTSTQKLVFLLFIWIFFKNYLKNYMTFRLLNKTLFYSSHFLPQKLYLNEYQLFKSIFSKKAAVKSAWNNFIKPNIKLLWQIQKSPPPSPPSGVGWWMILFARGPKAY